MVDYGKGKIYKIVVNNTEDEYRPYIGSTTKEYLSQRFVQHRKDYKRHKNGKNRSVSSYNLFDKYGIENCEIILIENYPCNSKDELMARERHWFDTIDNCNKCKPIKTEQEVINSNKIYYKRILELHPNHKEERKQNKYNCECGSYIRVADKSKHIKTKKHLNYIANIAPNDNV